MRQTGYEQLRKRNEIKKTKGNAMKRGEYIGKDLEGEPMYALNQVVEVILCVASIGVLVGAGVLVVTVFMMIFGMEVG